MDRFEQGTLAEEAEKIIYEKKCRKGDVEESLYKQGFRDGMEACKKNPKLDKAIKEGKQM